MARVLNSQESEESRTTCQDWSVGESRDQGWVGSHAKRGEERGKANKGASKKKNY